MRASGKPSSTDKRHSAPAQPSARRRPNKSTPVEQLRVEHCREAVLALRDHPAQSRTGLCKMLNRSATTMTKVIGDLVAMGWIVESTQRRSPEAGRPATILQLVPGSAQVLSLVVEPDAVHSAVVGLDLEPRHVQSHAIPVSSQNALTSLRQLERMAKAHARTLAAAGEPPLLGMAILVSGMTDTRLRTSLRSRALGWKDLDIAGYIEPRLGLPVLVHNNTRAMGFAEFRHLRLHEDQPLLFVQARFGLGAAMLNSAAPSQHGHYGVSELDHIPLGVNGFSPRVPSDANLVSVTNEAYLRAVLKAGPADGPVVPLLEQRRDAHDPTAMALYAQTLTNLSMGLGIAINLLHPRLIVLGGIYGLASPRFVAELHAQFPRHAHEEFLQGLQLQCSQLGRTGALQGAAIVAFDRLLREPATYHPVMETAA